MDFFAFDKIVVPINLQDHWLFVIANLSSKSLHLYDSLMQHLAKEHGSMMKKVFSFLKYVAQEKKEIELEDEEWSYDIQVVPQQNNFYDCGYYSMKILEYVSRGLKPNFEPKDMLYFKKLMVYELGKGTLMWCFDTMYKEYLWETLHLYPLNQVRPELLWLTDQNHGFFLKTSPFATVILKLKKLLLNLFQKTLTLD